MYPEHLYLKMCYFCIPSLTFFTVASVYWKSVSSFFFLVKYMREATPYVKRGSPVSEIGWETPPPESPRLDSPPITSSLSNPLSPPSQPFLSPQGDRRCIPLKMCYVTRAMTTPDPENRWVTHTFSMHNINDTCILILAQRAVDMSPFFSVYFKNTCVYCFF